MSAHRRGLWLPAALVVAALTSVACVATDGDGYYDGGNAYYSGAYYEPFPYGYGGWGRDYHVAPGRGGPRGGMRGSDRGGHAYRAAPAGHASPSMPGRTRKR